MQARLTDKNELAISVEDLINTMSEVQKRCLVDSLSCDNDIIKDVADQIFTGWTDACSHGGVCCTANADNSTGLDYAMRLFAKHGDDLKAREVARLEDALRFAEKTIADLRSEQWNRRG